MSQDLDNTQDEKDFLIDIDKIDDETLEASLRVALYRQDCPETIALSEYQLGLLAEAEAVRLKTHIDRCPYCQAELSRLAEFLTEEIPVSSPLPVAETSPWIQGQGFVWQPLREAGGVIIRVLAEALNTAAFNLQQGLHPVDRLALGRLRTSKSLDALFQLALQEGIEDLEVTVTATVKRSDPNHCTVTIEVNIPSRGGWPNLANTEVVLKRDDSIVATHITDAFGKTVFEKVATDELAKLSFEITPRA
jgi:hypothetical protein